MARVLSLASGTYLRPYVERSLYSNTDRIRVLSHSAAAEPFLPPFHFLNLEPILRCACDSYPARSDAFRNLDSSLHWLLAPAPYDEMRLISAITALESIVALTSGPAKILGASAFKKVTTAVRAVLKQLNTPDSMRTKIAELNRPSFNERVIDILDRYQVETADLPADWLGDMISARNKIVHSGVYFDGALEQPDIWNYILISREAVIRILLSVLGFSGAYFSALHDEKQICFPSCQPLSG